MPWTEFKLNDGHKIPGVGFGSSGHPLEKTADDINLAIECGFDHIDTAQSMSFHFFHFNITCSSEVRRDEDNEI